MEISSDDLLRTHDSFGILKLNDYVHVQRQVFNTLINEGFFDENKRRIEHNSQSGKTIEIDKSGIEETFGPGKRYQNLPRKLKELKLATIRKIPEIIHEGSLVTNDIPNHHKTNSGITYSYIKGTVSVNGTPYTVVLDIRQSPQKNKFWLHSVRTEESPSLSARPTEVGAIPYNELQASNRTIQQQETEVKSVGEDFAERYSVTDEEDEAAAETPGALGSRVRGSDIPEGYDSVDDYAAALEARADEERAQRLRNVPKEEFEGTPALQKLGVKIENSAGIYSHVDQLIAGNKAAKQVQRATQKAERRLRATEAERNFASGIAAGIYTAEDIPRSMDEDKVLELADYYYAENAAANDRLRQQRADIRANLQEKMRELFDKNDYVPKKDYGLIDPLSAIILNYRTPVRNMLHLFGDERGKAINEAVFDPVAVNEAERTRFINRMHDDVRRFKSGDGKLRKLRKAERALTQMVIEGKAAAEEVAASEMRSAIENAAHNIRAGGTSGDAAREFGLSRDEQDLAIRYARWLEAEEIMRSGKVDPVKVNNAAAKYSELFDQFYAAINDFLVAHGYEPIGFIKGYAPHIQPEENQTLLNKAFQALGINTDVTRLPASIAGLTANYRPNKRWNPYFLSRTGDVTQYDIASAFESYVDYMSDVLYHTDDIMRVREMARYFRQTYAPEDIKENLSQADELRYGSTEEKANYLRDKGVIGKASALSAEDVEKQMNDYVEKLFGDINETTKYSNLVMWLDNYANILAGKQSMADRGSEYGLGRGVLNFGNKVVRTFSQSNVAANFSSVINQTAQLPMIQAELGTRWTMAAIKDIVSGKLRKGEWTGESDFLTGKEGVNYLVSTPGEMVLTAMFKPLELMDTFVATVAVRGKYLKELHEGKSHREAMKAADAFGTAVMGSRMKGSKPLAFHSKKPFSQMLNIFQIEAFNSWEHIKEDLPRDFRTIEKEKGKGATVRALAGVILKGLLLTFIANRVTDKLYGGTPAPFDLLGLTANFIASGEGLTTNEYLETMIDNAWEKITGERLFDTDALKIGDEPFDVWSALKDLGYNVSNDIPFLRNAAGLLGLGDQSLPMPDLYGKGKDLLDSLRKSGISWDSGEDALALLSQILPGGRQLFKTATGAAAAARGGDFSGIGENEKLKYPIDRDDFWSVFKAMLFGKYSTEESDEYYASGASPLSAKQTQLWKSLTDGGADSMDVYNAIQDYRRIHNDEELDSYERGKAERDLIRSLDLTDDQKLEMYRELKDADSRAESFGVMMDTGMSFDEVMDAYDKYSELSADEDMKANEKATEFARWVDRQDYTDEQARTVKDELRYWNIIPAEASRYEKLSEAGIDDEAAFELTNSLAALEPENGTDNVSNLQRYRLIADSDMSDRDKLAAIGTFMGTDMLTDAGKPTQWAKLNDAVGQGYSVKDAVRLLENDELDIYGKWSASDAKAEGISFDTYSRWRDALSNTQADKDASGKTISGSKKTKVLEYIDSLPITVSQKDALYYDAGYSESTIDEAPWWNPAYYSTGGQTQPRRNTSGSGELQGLSLPSLAG